MKRNVKNLIFGIMPLFGMLISGCSLFNRDTSTSTSSVAPYTPPEGEPDQPDVADNYITAIHMKRTKDFFMQREEELDFNVTFDGGGDDSQKEIAWASSNPNIVQITTNADHPDLTRYCTLRALREGTATIVARSLFNTSLTASVSITVLDNSAYTYFWQLASNGTEKSEFLDSDGYPSTSGTVHFGTMEWTYKFDKAPIAVTGGQSLKFGSKNDPFGALHFEAENSQQIRKISVLCSSAAEHIEDGSAHGTSGDVGTSNITITVGDDVYVDNVPTPKNSNDSTAELDTITGGIRDTNPMTGKIQLDFSPTYYDGATKENSGAIYLKAIIIEYYRGELDRIEISEINEYNNQFYVGTKYDSRGVDVNAYFTASPSTAVNVGHDATFTMDNIDSEGNFVTSKANQTITASYSYTNSDNVTKTVTSDYTVNVAPKIEKIRIDGNMPKTEYLVREAIDYSGLSLNIFSEGIEDPIQSISLGEYEDAKFLAAFNVNNVQKYASKSLQQGFSISIRHYLSNLQGTLTFDPDDILVKQVSAIEVIYDSDDPINLVEGEKMDFTNFKAKITYDCGEVNEETFAFSELKNQTYHEDSTNHDLYRYNYIPYTPLVVDKSFATAGYTVVVQSALNNVKGELTFAPEQFSIKYISSIELKLTTFATTTYEETADMDYTGLTLDITYSDDTTEVDVPFSDFKARTTFEGGTKNEKGNKVANYTTKALFSISAPSIASLSLANGFDISIASSRDPAVNSTVHVDAGVITVTEVQPKQYQKIKSLSDLGAGGKLVFISLDEIGTTMKYWNADLPESGDYTVTKKQNYLTYTHTEALGDLVSIKSGPLSRAYFEVAQSGDFYTIKHSKSGKYFGADNSLYGSTSSAKTKFEVTFEENGNANWKATYTSSGATEIRYIKYNSNGGSDKFGGYKITGTGNNAIQVYRLIVD